MSFIRKALLVLSSTALLIAIGVYSYSHGYWRFAYPNPATYPVMGIDVSHHQGDINWPTVAQQNVHFAFIKATEGATHTDTLFSKNIEGATAAGIPSAPYHFFTLCKSGAEQATNFLTATSGISTTLPWVVDLEFVGNCSARPTVEAFQTELRTFLAQVEAHTKHKLIFYITYHFQDEYLQNAFPQNPVWMRDIFSHPPVNQPWDFWQYADHARLPGIQGPVDLNVFRGNSVEWAEYLNQL